MRKWENMGDVNFMQYGGCLVAPHWDEDVIQKNPSLSTMYDVFQLTPCHMISDNAVMVGLGLVDVGGIDSSSWIDKAEVIDSWGLENDPTEPYHEIMSPEEWAVALVEYYGVNEFSGSSSEEVITVDEARQRMIDIGAGEYTKL